MNLADMRMMVQYEGRVSVNLFLHFSLFFAHYVVDYTDYTQQHRVIKLFWRMLEQDFTEFERRALLLFWTGSSVPPRGGFSVDADYDEVGGQSFLYFHEYYACNACLLALHT
jgi:hypothetical protein